MKLDNLYFSFRELDNYNKPFHFVISERNTGRNKAMVLKMQKALQEHKRTFLYFKGKYNEIR